MKNVKSVDGISTGTTGSSYQKAEIVFVRYYSVRREIPVQKVARGDSITWKDHQQFGRTIKFSK